MTIATPRHPHFIVNEKGDKESVVLSINDYSRLLEELEDLAIVSERQSEASIPLPGYCRVEIRLRDYAEKLDNNLLWSLRLSGVGWLRRLATVFQRAGAWALCEGQGAFAGRRA